MSFSGRCDGSGVKPEVLHQPRGDEEHRDEDDDPHQERHAQIRHLGNHAAEHRAAQHRGTRDHLATAHHGLEAARVARETERIDEPRLDRAGEERKPEPEQHRDDRPGRERRLRLPEQPVQQRRACERDGPEQVRDAPAPDVGDDTGRHLESDHPGGEECVRRERLQVAQPGVQQEERVDAPDERRGERVPEHERQVDALDASRERIHRPRRVNAGTVRIVPSDAGVPAPTAPTRLHCPALGGVVQLVRTPACHAGGRGFESRRSRLEGPGNGAFFVGRGLPVADAKACESGARVVHGRVS